MFYIYILGCLQTGRTYVGQTDHLVRRYRQHQEGSTRTTREKLPQPVVLYFEILPSRSEAMTRERYFKSGSGYRVRLEIARGAFKLFGFVG